MPTQLTNNSAVYFICARNFLYAGKEYKLGDKFPQEAGVGRIDLLVRTRRLIAVVDNSEDRPRHWHHHVWLRSEISKKLGLLNNDNVSTVTGSSLYNKPKQMGLEMESFEATPVEPSTAEAVDLQAKENAATETVLEQENDESDEQAPEEAAEESAAEEPQNVTGEPQEPEEEPVITEDDLYDPAEHNAPEVVEYLTSDISTEEFERVVAAERNGKARKGVLDNV